VTPPSGVKLLFIHDPWGTNIEVNQWPRPMDAATGFHLVQSISHAPALARRRQRIDRVTTLLLLCMSPVLAL
jgi:hypothetical protein